jgi:hypothetical protein
VRRRRPECHRRCGLDIRRWVHGISLQHDNVMSGTRKQQRREQSGGASSDDNDPHARPPGTDRCSAAQGCDQ